MKLKFIPLATALLPAVVVHVCYLLAANQGHVSWCFPYFPDCVSISVTGRHSPESVVFRAGIIPTAVLMMIYWRLSLDWLKALGTYMVRLNHAMVWLGMVAALGLFVYSSLLGEVGDLYRQQRRIGMILFYIFTYLAQLLMTVQIASVMRTQSVTMSVLIYRSLVATSGLVAILGAISLLSWAFYDDYRRYEDAFEWGLIILLLGHTFITHFAWRESGFQARFIIPKKRS
jgi:hypothetical protein